MAAFTQPAELANLVTIEDTHSNENKSQGEAHSRPPFLDPPGQPNYRHRGKFAGSYVPCSRGEEHLGQGWNGEFIEFVQWFCESLGQGNSH